MQENAMQDREEEFAPTPIVSVVMEAAMMGNAKSLEWMLSSKAFIWNQRGPCGRLPEQAALDAGHMEAYQLLLSARERHEMQREIAGGGQSGPKRL